MPDQNSLQARYPTLGERLGRESFAVLPTPIVHHRTGNRSHHRIAIKCDDLTGTLYGGNKVRKLEYALWPARERNKKCIATFGASGSNHALATALYARSLGYDCVCFLVHQPATSSVRDTLLTHLSIGTEIVRFGGGRAKRIATLRKHLQGRRAWIVPAGGSSWLGTMGFVNAGLELADQIDAGSLSTPDRIYIATGTMGSAVGLALGLALANLDVIVESVRVSMTHIANESIMQRLLEKTVYMMQRLDPSIPKNIARRVQLRLRHNFFAGGYAKTDERTDHAIAFARDQLGIQLECTYTGKAMAALLHDLQKSSGGNVLFWNTYNSVSLPIPAVDPDIARLPDEFRRYVE